MHKLTSEALLYTAASAAALAVDVGLLSVLVSWLSWPSLPSATLSFIAGGVLLYWLSVTRVFRVRRIHKPLLELPLFLALGTVGLLINIAVMSVAVELTHAHYLVAKASAAGCTFTSNFLLRRYVLFSSSIPTPGQAQPESR